MEIKNLYKKIALLSPYIEVALRQIYWKNIKVFKKYNPNKATNVAKKQRDFVDFEKVIDWLKAHGIGRGSLLIVHSGYGELECTGLTPEQIIDDLLGLVGPEGTLAMPVIRRYKKKQVENQSSGSIYKYDVKKTVVISGMLPYTLMQHKDAVISHHPFNPMCAVGPLAKAMMEHNLEGDAPSPHGPNSSWRFCYDHGAKVCSIGTDIDHHNTIGHIVEESFGGWYWPDDVWFDFLTFVVVDENKKEQEIIVRNRKEEWGKLHLAEINSIIDAKKAHVMCSDNVEGITVGFVDPQKMVPFFQLKNKKGYPYFLFPWESPKKVK